MALHSYLIVLASLKGFRRPSYSSILYPILYLLRRSKQPVPIQWNQRVASGTE